MFKILFLFVFSLFLSAACAKVDKPSMQSHPYVIEYQGAMHAMFETGDIGGKLSLASLKNRPHLYALGPLENLSGEITVWDGVPYISFIRDNSVSVVTSHELKRFSLFGRKSKRGETYLSPRLYGHLPTSKNLSINLPRTRGLMFLNRFLF